MEDVLAKCPACESPEKWAWYGHIPGCVKEQIHCLEPYDCEPLPPHTKCWEDASGMHRWKNEE